MVDFSNVVMFTDIHYGMRNNSRDHNANCENFIIWMIEEAKKRNIKTCLFLGDYHHIRSAINISTLNYSVSGLKLLNEAFDDVYMILGNHDTYFKNRIDLHSIPYAEQFKNIKLINEITTIQDFTFVPWLIEDKWKEIKNIKSPYVFGHFELPFFQMNAMVQMPDHGQLNSEHFNNQKMVFSGHFHKRQNRKNVWYIGNAFPHNFSDAWDDDRGAVFWTPGNEPEFVQWHEAPKYRTGNLSLFLKNPTKYIDNKTYAKITVDVDISYEETVFIKDLFLEKLKAKEITFLTSKQSNDVMFDANANISFESVDHIVIDHLKSIESVSISSKKLIEIYQTL